MLRSTVLDAIGPRSVPYGSSNLASFLGATAR